MSSNAIKIVAAVFVLLAIVLAFIGFRMTSNYAATAKPAAQAEGPPPVQQVQVVVATKPLLANQPIASDQVALEPVSVAPPNYYTNVDDVVNRVPLIDVDVGSPITPRFFKENNQLAKLIPPGFQAVSLAWTDVVGVGGFVRPGDIVDVLLYLHNDTSNKVDPAQARILLKDALVLAADDRIVAPPVAAQNNPNQQQPQQQTRRERTVVVAVPVEQVTRVMLGASLGEVRLALHGQEQTVAANAPAATDAAAAKTAEGAAGKAGPAPVSGASLPQQGTAKPGDSKLAIGEADMPDLPITSAELAKLKTRASKGAPAGIVVYRGPKRSTVYP